MKILQNLENAYRAQAPTIRFRMGGVGIASIPEPRDVEAAQYTIDRCMEQLEDAVDAFDALRESGHLTLAEASSPMAAVRGILRVLERRNEIIVALQEEVALAQRGPIARLPEDERANLAEGEPYFVLRAGVRTHAAMIDHLDHRKAVQWRAWFDENVGPKPGQEWIRKGKPEEVFTIKELATGTDGEGFRMNDTRTVIYCDTSTPRYTFTSLRLTFIEEFEPAPASKTL